MLRLLTTSAGKLALLCTALAAVLLSGCVAVRPTVRSDATLLLSVVVVGDYPKEQQPAVLVVTLDDVSAGTARQFAFPASSRIPGQRAEFLVRMEVPAGLHRLSRVAGTAVDGSAIAGLDFAFGIDVGVAAKASDYLGHLELGKPRSGDRASGDARIVIVDAYEDDLPEFVRAWPELRRRKWARRGPQEITAVALAPAMPQESAANSSARAAPLEATAASHLPPRSQQAFDSFLKSKYPRAFAVGLSGATGVATGGTNVIDRALRNCKRAQGKRRQSCKLFALDDTLMQSIEGSAGMTNVAVKR